jgi:hypothetical protein
MDNSYYSYFKWHQNQIAAVLTKSTKAKHQETSSGAY